MLSTAQKVLIARVLSKATLSARRLCGAASTPLVRRGGIQWSLDLREGIDLSIYLLGGFELATLRRYKALVRGGFFVIDIGANIGAHTLPLAELVGPTGKVIAFEPTKYAFEKLRANILLNPDLADRIVPSQSMLVTSAHDALPGAVYSSWPLDNTNDLHTEHRGRLKSTEGAKAHTLDDYVEKRRLDRLDFIKLDVDGHETEVLLGAQETLKRFRPAIMLELAPYVYEHKPDEFDQALELLWALQYEFTELVTGTPLPRNPAKLRAMVPFRGGMNALVRAIS